MKYLAEIISWNQYDRCDAHVCVCVWRVCDVCVCVCVFVCVTYVCVCVCVVVISSPGTSVLNS